MRRPGMGGGSRVSPVNLAGDDTGSNPYFSWKTPDDAHWLSTVSAVNETVGTKGHGAESLSGRKLPAPPPILQGRGKRGHHHLIGVGVPPTGAADPGKEPMAWFDSTLAG